MTDYMPNVFTRVHLITPRLTFLFWWTFQPWVVRSWKRETMFGFSRIERLLRWNVTERRRHGSWRAMVVSGRESSVTVPVSPLKLVTFLFVISR